MQWSDKIQKAFFTLLRSGLWNRAVENEACRNLTDSEWEIIWQQATQQSVRGIIYEGACLLPENQMPDEYLMIRWTAEIDGIERRNRHLNQVLGDLIQMMKENEVIPVVLKGQGVAQFYERPFTRECGDIDLYFINQEDEDRLLAWVKTKGCSVCLEPDGTHEYQLQNVEIEHHNRLFDLYSARIQPFLTQLTDRHGFIEIPLRDKDINICVPSPILNLLLLNVHILKHMMGHGIGLRQFCDLARAYHTLNHQYSATELKTCYAKCGLLRWSRLLHAVLVMDLGLSVNELPYKDFKFPSTKPLVDRILKEGNFGNYSLKRGNVLQPVWERKVRTVLAIFRKIPFSVTYAPREVIAQIGRLFIGNLNL